MRSKLIISFVAAYLSINLITAGAAGVKNIQGSPHEPQGHAENTDYDMPPLMAAWWATLAANGDSYSLKKLKDAASKDNANAQYSLGSLYLNGDGVQKSYAQALFWLQKSAVKKNKDAQFLLGVMYDNGLGVPQDYAQAASWYRKAAEQGEAKAQSNLGVMYANGQGVPQDYAQAVSWYRKAAEQGEAKAQSNLGFMYYKGLGVPQDAVIAYALFNVSATNYPSQDNPAAANREKISARMTPHQIAEGQALTRRMLSDGIIKAIDAMR